MNIYIYMVVYHYTTIYQLVMYPLCIHLYIPKGIIKFMFDYMFVTYYPEQSLPISDTETTHFLMEITIF